MARDPNGLSLASVVSLIEDKEDELFSLDRGDVAVLSLEEHCKTHKARGAFGIQSMVSGNYKTSEGGRLFKSNTRDIRAAATVLASYVEYLDGVLAEQEARRTKLGLLLEQLRAEGKRKEAELEAEAARDFAALASALDDKNKRHKPDVKQSGGDA
jgi:hypothetical protein